MINEIILAIANFLQTIIIDNQIISLDLWSIVHITSGLLIMLILIKLKNKNRFTILIAILIIWELFEFTNYQILKNSLFIREKATNIVWDIIAGISGGALAKYLPLKNSCNKV